MSVIRSNSNVELLGSTGLSEEECKAVHEEAYRLMADGRSLGVGEEEQDGGFKNVFVLDVLGNRFTVARNVGAYLLMDPAFGIIAVAKLFDEIVEELRHCLKTASQDPLSVPRRAAPSA